MSSLHLIRRFRGSEVVFGTCIMSVEYNVELGGIFVQYSCLENKSCEKRQSLRFKALYYYPVSFRQLLKPLRGYTKRVSGLGQ